MTITLSKISNTWICSGWRHRGRRWQGRQLLGCVATSHVLTGCWVTCAWAGTLEVDVAVIERADSRGAPLWFAHLRPPVLARHSIGPPEPGGGSGGANLLGEAKRVSKSRRAELRLPGVVATSAGVVTLGGGVRRRCCGAVRPRCAPAGFGAAAGFLGGVAAVRHEFFSHAALSWRLYFFRCGGNAGEGLPRWATWSKRGGHQMPGGTIKR